MSRRSRSRHYPLSEDQILKKLDRDRGNGIDSDLRRKIAALVLANCRGWSAEKVANHFAWPIEDVKRWIDAGKFQRAPKPDEKEKPN